MRLAWFHPTFHPECGLTLTDSGLCALHCRVPWPDLSHIGLGPDLLSPRWSRELLWLPEPELSALHEAFDQLVPAPEPEGQCRDGCSYRLERGDERWQGNLGDEWPPALALTRAVLQAARCARWRSTRTAFDQLGRYLA